jgi:hypothetical protein
MSTNPKKWDESHFPVSLVHVATENDLLYDRFGIAIQGVLDITEFNAKRHLEQDDAANIEAHRQVEMDAVRGQT